MRLKGRVALVTARIASGSDFLPGTRASLESCADGLRELGVISPSGPGAIGRSTESPGRHYSTW